MGADFKQLTEFTKKIEKLNDNQIRCTLTPADLADRQIKISELVCGSEKARKRNISALILPKSSKRSCPY